MTRAVPGDLAAAVDIDDRCSVCRPLGVLCAFPGGVNSRMLEEKDSVRRPPCDNISVN